MVNRDASVLLKAMELAESGRHIDCLTIESALIEEGYLEAAELLKYDHLRRGLRTICRKHWSSGEDDLADAARRRGDFQ